ncbi:MAG: valine--tRNA ligase [Neisseriaceae bacterium]
MEVKKYNPQTIENKWYKFWESQGYFRPNLDTRKQTFSIQLPPPNVTGILHMGHAFNQTIMDAAVRYHRMCGKNVCWIPGFDHSGIATQMVVERQLAVEGSSRQHLGREKFISKVWDWKNTSGGTMREQMKRLGCSVDWSREYFTMDEQRAKAVNEAFVRLYEAGLIYRGKKLVNWDPLLETAISDLEVENIEEQGFLWHIKYFSVNNPTAYLSIATTRPETLLGDVAIAVHPEDSRYRAWVGQKVRIPLVNRTIPVITDTYVEKEFGTGCVKITPAHDFNDYSVGQRHQLQLINVLDNRGNILKSAQVYEYGSEVLTGTLPLPEWLQGIERLEAREKIIERLKLSEELLKVEPHTLMTPHGDRTGALIEPMLTDQWFIAMEKKPRGEVERKTLGEEARSAVDSGQVTFIPGNWINTYRQWVENLEDWCISRQLWWGHQIPAWYDEKGHIIVARSEEEAIQKAGTQRLRRDEDVLDTWFSSALVPFSTLGWPEPSDEIEMFLPSNLLVTGHEIIFFWVARMIMLTTYFTGKIPFPQVYIHGIVKDHEGKKMSKSEGNVLDPVDVIEGIDLPTLLQKRTTGLRKPEKAEHIKRTTQKLYPTGLQAYGADALRYTMASYASLGRSVNFDLKRCEGYRNFCNKLWNVSRFVLITLEQHFSGLLEEELDNITPSFADTWIMEQLELVRAATTEAFESYRFDLAAQHLYDFVWNEYCDWYIEISKVQLKLGDERARQKTCQTLVKVLEISLRLLHPLIPFITEELWQLLLPWLKNGSRPDTIMLAPWPLTTLVKCSSEATEKVLFLKAWVNGVRQLKIQMGLKPGDQPPLLVEGQRELELYSPYLSSLARVGSFEILEKLPPLESSIGIVRGVRFSLNLKIDKDVEHQRITKELNKLNKLKEKISNKLSQPGYQEKAPKALVEKDISYLDELTAEIEKLEEQAKKLG